MSAWLTDVTLLTLYVQNIGPGLSRVAYTSRYDVNLVHDNAVLLRYAIRDVSLCYRLPTTLMVFVDYEINDLTADGVPKSMDTGDQSTL